MRKIKALSSYKNFLVKTWQVNHINPKQSLSCSQAHLYISHAVLSDTAFGYQPEKRLPLRRLIPPNSSLQIRTRTKRSKYSILWSVKCDVKYSRQSLVPGKNRITAHSSRRKQTATLPYVLKKKNPMDIFCLFVCRN